MTGVQTCALPIWLACDQTGGEHLGELALWAVPDELDHLAVFTFNLALEAELAEVVEKDFFDVPYRQAGLFCKRHRLCKVLLDDRLRCCGERLADLILRNHLGSDRR